MTVVELGVVVAGAAVIFFATVFFGTIFCTGGFAVDVVEDATPCVDVLTVGSIGVDVATTGVVVAIAWVLVAACSELVETVEVAAVSDTPPPELVIPVADGRENGCNKASQLLPDAAVTA